MRRFQKVVCAERDTGLHVIDTGTGKETSDVILRPSFSGDAEWLPSNEAFVNSRLQDLPAGAPATYVEQKPRTYLHYLGRAPVPIPRSRQ